MADAPRVRTKIEERAGDAGPLSLNEAALEAAVASW
jgi:hypothetical protein